MAIRNALGRGLDSLIPMDDVPARGSSAINNIPLDRITPNPDQPRTTFDEEALAELAASIRELGIIQPLSLRKTGADTYQIIAGERRFRAARMAGLSDVPAYIRTANEAELTEMALIENIQREDLNAIEIALGMQRLIDECHLTQDALSEKMGKKRSTVANYIRLLKLPDEVQYALKEGLISMGHAKAIAAAPEEHRLRVLKRCVRKGLSVRQTEELARRMCALAEAAADPAAAGEEEEYPESYTRLVEQLERVFSDQIAIRRTKNGGGRIVIGFTDDAQIEQFLRRFTAR